jgi:hypothetical protein
MTARHYLFSLLILLQFIISNNPVANNSNQKNKTPEKPHPANSEDIINIYKQINEPGLNPDALAHALKGFNHLKHKNILSNDSILTVIDYSKSSVSERFYVIDIKNRKILFKSLVAHGKNSGLEYAASFSNVKSSKKSCVGLFLTGEPYYGKHGFSLRLNGLESNINDNARERAIVIHGAGYVDESFIKNYGRLGRSYGCPALPLYNHKDIINTIKNESCLYIYYPGLT